VRFVGRANQDQPIAPHAEMPVGDASSQFGWIVGAGLRQTINVDIVVSNALHFGESHRTT
jgi:hypothetical protein